MNNITILGYGNIGQAVYYGLNSIFEENFSIRDCKINLFDVRPITFPREFQVETEVHNFDLKNSSDMLRLENDLIKPADIVINALPYQFNTIVVDLCSDNNKHYFGLTEDYESLPEWKSDAVYMPQCGLAPGAVSIVAQHFIKDYEIVNNVKMRVGALPRYTDNKLKYAWTWNTHGLVNEYYKQALVLEDGELKKVEPLTGLEEISIDGEFFQAFHTAGGIGTLAHTYGNTSEENNTNIDYKTIRYFGHHDYITFMKDDLGMSQDEMHTTLIKMLPYSNQDVVVLYVYVDGIKDGRLQNDVYYKKFYPIEIGSECVKSIPLTSIQYTTAFGLTANVELLMNNQIKSKGHVKQEMIPFSSFTKTKTGKYYKL